MQICLLWKDENCICVCCIRGVLIVYGNLDSSGNTYHPSIPTAYLLGRNTLVNTALHHSSIPALPPTIPLCCGPKMFSQLVTVLSHHWLTWHYKRCWWPCLRSWCFHPLIIRELVKFVCQLCGRLGRQSAFPLGHRVAATMSVQTADLHVCLRDAAAGSAQLKCVHPHLPLHISTQTQQALHWAESHKVQGPMSSLLWFPRTKSKAAGFFSLMIQLGCLTSWRIPYFLRKKFTRRRVFRKICLHKQAYFSWNSVTPGEVGKANHIMCLTAGNLTGRLLSHSPWLKTSSNLQ